MTCSKITWKNPELAEKVKNLKQTQEDLMNYIKRISQIERMKTIFITIFFLFSINAFTQKVYSCSNMYDADFKVYICSSRYQADLLVYKVKSQYAVNDNGIWYFCNSKYDAKKKIYFVDNKWEADLLIYFVDNKYAAKWNNLNKKYLICE